MVIEVWQSVTYDSVAFLAGQRSYDLFLDGPDNSSDEDLRLVERVATKFILQNFRDSLLKLVGIDDSDAIVLSDVTKPFTDCSRKPGDIDILAFSKTDPRQSIAIELKVLRKRIRNSNNNFIDGLDKLKKGVRQCEGLLSLGFGSVALGIILLANTSNQSGINLACRQLKDDSWEAIRHESLRQIGEMPIGLLNFEINQTTHKPISECGSISGIFIRQSRQSQDPVISETLNIISKNQSQQKPPVA